jgi:hypothetical protein
MKLRTLVLVASCLFLMGMGRCNAEEVWATGNSLYEVIGDDLQAHGSNHPLTSLQTNAVCLLLGYFRGFAEAAAIAEHYDATSLPFILPDSITAEQMEKVVYKFLLDNPDKLALKGDGLVVAALAKEYPNPSFTPITPKG